MNDTNADPPARRGQALAVIEVGRELMAALAQECPYHHAPPPLPEKPGRVEVAAQEVPAQQEWARTLECTRAATPSLGCTCGRPFYLSLDVPRVAGERYLRLLDAAVYHAAYGAPLPELYRALWEVSVWTVRGGIYPLTPDFDHGPVLAEPR